MAKRLSCRDVGVDGDFVACADTEEAIFEKAGDHVRKGHGMSEISKSCMTSEVRHPGSPTV